MSDKRFNPKTLTVIQTYPVTGQEGSKNDPLRYVPHYHMVDGTFLAKADDSVKEQQVSARLATLSEALLNANQENNTLRDQLDEARGYPKESTSDESSVPEVADFVDEGEVGDGDDTN